MAVFIRGRIKTWRVLVNGDSLPAGAAWLYIADGRPVYAADGRRLAIMIQEA